MYISELIDCLICLKELLDVIHISFIDVLIVPWEDSYVCYCCRELFVALGIICTGVLV